MNKVNWLLIEHLPADGKIYSGSPEYGAFRVLHAPATSMRVESLFAETGLGLARRRLVKGKFAKEELLGGSIRTFEMGRSV